MQPQLEAIDREIGHRLTHYYRITTVAIEAAHSRLEHSAMLERFTRLCKFRWVCPLTAWCSNVEPITAPLFAWQPGQAEPDYGAISYQARNRWDHNPVRKTTVYAASRKMLDLFGLPQRPHVKLQQATHDLGCNRMFWFAKASWPQLEFLSEDLFEPRGFGVGVEDAQLLDGERIAYVLEHAGAYRKDRVAHFHQHVAERNLPYLLF